MTRMVHQPAEPALPRQFADPGQALASLLAQISPVGVETIAWQEAAGRVLAQAIVADRDSPSCDTSAMDGYALRVADLRPEGTPVAGEVFIGQPPPPLPPGEALRIMTGAAVPPDAEAVIPREDVDEQPARIVPHAGVTIRPGQNIRRQGENLRQGQTAIAAGRPIDAAVLAAATTFGLARIQVYRKLRLAVIVSGAEVRPVEAAVQPWELRDSNSPALWAMLQGRAWLGPPSLHRARDDRDAITSTLQQTLADADAVILTGGVSKGDYDFVPDAVTAAGGRRVFHGLPIRPGQPILAAVGPRGQAIFGLPGNPVAVLIAARRLVVAALRRQAGHVCPDPPCAMLRVDTDDGRRLRLWWYRPVRLVAHGVAELVPSLGSGDMVSAARGDGFIEVPPQQSACGPWPFWHWEN
jgi:molybdopterin molybdotransferase